MFVSNTSHKKNRSPKKDYGLSLYIINSTVLILFLDKLAGLDKVVSNQFYQIGALG